MIKSQQEIIAQAITYIQNMDDNQYTFVLSPYFSSSAGTHIRHIIDHYRAVMLGRNNTVDYNQRNRQCPTENCRKSALSALEDIDRWLAGLTEEALSTPLCIISEVSICEYENSLSKSSLGRELVFVSSHAVHHYSLLKIMAQMMSIPVNNDLGIAPTTASFIREHTLAG